MMKKGFTLIELLIGISIFSIIAASVYSSLYMGIKVWKQEESSDQIIQEAELTLKIIERAIRCAFLNPENEKIKFVGLEEKVDFFSSSPEGDIEKVSFYLQGNETDKFSTLVRSKCIYMLLDEEEMFREEVVNTKIAELKLKYFNQNENIWHETWPEESTLPNAVSVEVSFAKDFDKNSSFDLIKYINIPMANIMDFSRNEQAQ